MPATTTNFGLNNPLVNDPTDQDLWGGYLNTNNTNLDTLLKTLLNFTPSNKIASFSVTIPTAGSTTTNSAKVFFTCNATAGAIVPSLPAAATATGMHVAFKKTDSSANAVTITANGAELIDGATTLVLGAQYSYAVLVCDGTGWNILAQTPPSVGTASTSVAGILKLATAAIFATGTDATAALTAASFGANITVSGTELTIKLPTGYILKLGTVTGITLAASAQTVNFQVAFPTSCIGVITTLNGSVGGGDTGYVTVNTTSASQFTTVYKSNRTYIAWGT
jgi:hypothetical protein